MKSKWIISNRILIQKNKRILANQFKDDDTMVDEIIEID
jgi:hypothetical protein